MSRAQLRGKPLDEDCRRAKISHNEYGPDDTRCFCYGFIDASTESLLDKCSECGALAYNAVPLREAKK